MSAYSASLLAAAGMLALLHGLDVVPDDAEQRVLVLLGIVLLASLSHGFVRIIERTRETHE